MPDHEVMDHRQHRVAVVRRMRHESFTPAGVFAAAVLLAAQGMLGMIWGIAVLANVDQNPLLGLAVLVGSAFALALAFALVALRPWARLGAGVLEAAALTGWLFWIGASPLRASFGIAAAAAVIALLLLPGADEAFARERVEHDTA